MPQTPCQMSDAMAVLSDAQEVGRWIEHNVSTADPAWAMSEAIKKKVQLPSPSLESVPTYVAMAVLTF